MYQNYAKGREGSDERASAGRRRHQHSDVRSRVDSEWRPITKLSDDPRDLEPLTSNHLLLLQAGPTLPPGTFSKQDNYSQHWREVQYLADVFWRRWIREYLPSLQEQQKWNKKQRILAVDDIVLVLDDKTPRNSWPRSTRSCYWRLLTPQGRIRRLIRLNYNEH